MERRTTIEKAKTLYKENFIGIKELQPFFRKLDIPAELSQGIEMPDIPYSTEELNKYAKDYILILGTGKIGNINLSIRFIRDKMGINPEISEPCFYNQDWYLKENFIDTILENKWYLIRKNVFEETRAIQPDELIEKGITFPSAILCTYTFFSYYFYNDDLLWKYDFVWCSDVDHNGDRIYVGKYKDMDGINKNGFSIHRHLALRDCYSAINTI